MALGERFRGGGTRGIARFLADHQHCDAGFDVRREDEPGSGRLRITCLGCGDTVAYRAAEAGEMAATGIDIATNGEGRAPVRVPPARPAPPARAPAPPAEPAGQAATPPPRDPETGRDAPGQPPVRQGPDTRLSRLPGWVPAALIGALIAGGLAMVVIGL